MWGCSEIGVGLGSAARAVTGRQAFLDAPPRRPRAEFGAEAADFGYRLVAKGPLKRARGRDQFGVQFCSGLCKTTWASYGPVRDPGGIGHAGLGVELARSLSPLLVG